MRPTMSLLAMLFLFCEPGAVLSSQSNSMSPGTPSHLEPVVVEGVETLSVPPSPVPRFTFADLAATVLAYLPRRRRWRLGPVPYDVHEALPPVLSALFVYMFACSMPRFQL